MGKQALEQTRGEFKFVGKVTGLENTDRVLKTGETRNGKPFKSLNFSIKTSEANQLRVSLFAMQQEDVYVYNPKTKKTTKKKYSDWKKNGEKWEQSGNMLIGVNTRITDGSDDDVIRLPQWEAVDHIMDNLKNGDSVMISGDIAYSPNTSENSNGKPYINYNISSIYKTKNPIDFNSEDFKEQNNFKQQFVFVDSERDEEREKLDVIARIIDYNGTYLDTNFVINYAGSKALEKLANVYENQLTFGTTIYAHGAVHNRAVEIEQEVSDDDFDDDDFMSALMGEDDPTETFTSYINELEIKGTAKSTKKIQSIEKDRYSESDFTDENDSVLVEDIDEEEDDFFGEEEDDDFDNDDLPFDI